MKSKNIAPTKTLLYLSLIILLLIVVILTVNSLRPIPNYTLYRIQSDGEKSKIKHIKSLSVAKKQMHKYADPAARINVAVENAQGKRMAIAYGIINLNSEGRKLLNYYDEHLDQSQTLDPKSGGDALFLDTRSINGKLQTQFQTSTSVGLIDINDIEILNIYNPQEVASFSKYIVKDGNLYHQVTKDVTQKGSIEEIFLGKANSKFENATYYSWDGAYFYNSFERLISDKVLLKKTKKAYIQYSIPYISQAIKQKTNYTIDELNTFILNNLDKNSVLQNSAALFFNAQKKYQINALSLFAIACLESDYGMSNNAINKQVLYAKQTNTDYDSIANSIDEFAKNTLINQYINPKNALFNGDYFGSKSEGINYAYSKDSYWGEKVSSVYATIDQELGLKDRKLKASTFKER